MERIIEEHNADLCVLCGSTVEITREHIIPQWAFGANPEKYLVSAKNNQPTTYIKATIPACRTCNSDLLGAFEDSLKRMLVEKEPEEINDYDRDCIIWWLQYIGFKLQLMDLRNRFLRYKGNKYVPSLSDIPVAMFWGSDTTPGQVFRILRKSRRNLISKWKDDKYNSLIIFTTSNENFHFFHKVDDFIFIEMPQIKKAFFFFFNKEHEEYEDAQKECKEIIEKVYGG